MSIGFFRLAFMAFALWFAATNNFNPSRNTELFLWGACLLASLELNRREIKYGSR